MRSASAGRSARFSYPEARVTDVVDDYHGVRIADPFRWLEDPLSAETQRWVSAQNELTRTALADPERDELASELTRLYDYPRASVPIKRGGRYFFTFNSGLQDQPALYAQQGLEGAPRLLVDPNVLSADGTAALTAFFANDQGTRVAYGISRSGSDRQEFFIRDVETGEDLPDRLRWLKFASVAWTPDGEGFYYTRFPEPGTVPSGSEEYYSKVCYHGVGMPQEADPILYERPEAPEIAFSVDVTSDGRWVVITASKGASDRSEVFLLGRLDGSISALFTTFEHAWVYVGDAAGRLFFITDRDAPRGRIVSIDPRLRDAPREVVPEGAGRISAAAIAGRTLAVSRLENASDRVSLYHLNGTASGGIDLPPFVSVLSLEGTSLDDELTLGFWSYTQPPAPFVYDTSTCALTGFNPAAALAPSATARPDATAYVTRQVWFESKDGTRVSMFLAHRGDVEMDGERPVLLTGYGGFDINMTPMFDPANLLLIDRGGVLAVPQLRGGGEYGEAWHQAGMLGWKQNVFDDFIAAAEWLIGARVTNPGRLAIEGGSNGGLLTAAVMLQRPDLFGAVVCRVPVADMLRYHLFTIGRFWIPEYGSADDPEQFAFLLRYSPYHNIVPGRAYPPMLVTTADTDDRVSPGMAKKLAARLQAEATGGPFLIRIDTRAGHGAGKPVTKMIDEDTDIFAFLSPLWR
jgi:prolyl oligopeptidase